MAQWRRDAHREARRARRRVLLIGLGFVLASVVTTSALVLAANRRERHVARERLATQSREGAALVDAFLAGEIETLQAVAAAPSVVSGDRAAMRDFFRRADPSGADAGGGFAWVDRDGRLQVLVASSPDAVPADLAGRDYVARTLATQRPYVSDAVLSGGSVPIVVVTVPTLDAQGAPSGLVLRAERLDDANPLVRALDAIDGARLVDGRGAFLVRSGAVPTGSLSYANAGGTPAPGPYEAAPDHVASVSPVSGAPWTVAVEVPTSDLYGTLDDQRIRQMLGIALGTVLGVVTVLALARRSAAQTLLHAEVVHQRSQATSLGDIAAGLSASLNAAGVADVVTRQVKDTLGADAVSVGLLDDAGRALEWVANVGYEGAASFPTMPFETSSAAVDTVRTAAPVEIAGVAGFVARYPDLRAHVAGIEDATWLHWPLVQDETCVGEIGLMWRRARTIDDDDRRFVATVADLLAQALRRTRAYADERDLAQALQRGALTKLPDLDGLTLRADYRPALHTTVGGDWFDVLRLPSGAVFCCVGDVVGHGLDAVEDMVQLRNAARALAVAGMGAATILDHLDRFCATTTLGRYATLALAIVDAAHETVTYASAGHPPPLLRHPDGRVDRLDAATRTPLGIGGRSPHVEIVVTFPVGATLALYTDGLVESRRTAVDDGIARLAAAIAAFAVDAPDASGRLIATVLADDHERRDDLCLLVVRRDA